MRTRETLLEKFLSMFESVKKLRRSVVRPINTDHYQLVVDRGLSIQSPDGKLIIENLALSYTTCSIHCIRAPLTSDRKIVLDHLEGLNTGDDIIVLASFYGASAIPAYQLPCKIMDKGLNYIVVDRDLPKHITKNSNGLVVLRRSEEKWSCKTGEFTVHFEGEITTIAYSLHTPHFDMRIQALSNRNSSRIEFKTTTTFLQPVRLFNLSIVLQSPLPISEVFLKNRARRLVTNHPIEADIWLWKEGARSKSQEYGWLVLNNPDIASTEILTAGRGPALKTLQSVTCPTVVLNLLHYHSQHYRRHVENMAGDYSFSTFEENSLPAFNRGNTVHHAFAIHVGKQLTSPPRLSLVPHGFRAAHVWTEHADKTTMDSHRAAYFGDQQATSVESAIGGFAYYRHVVTKSVFFDNPHQYQNVITKNGNRVGVSEMLSYARSNEFTEFLDTLAAEGNEICLHALSPNDVFVNPENIGKFYGRYRSRSWIDHGMQEVRATLGWQGFIPFSTHNLINEIVENNIRYFWTWSSTDFMPKSKTEINLLHNAKAEFMPTPLYWKHPAMPTEAVIWASHEASIDGFSDEGLDKLIAERGVSIHQHYYPYLIDEKYDFKFIEVSADGRYKATARFNAVLKAMAKRNQDSELLLTTVGNLVAYWLDTEYVEFEMTSDGFILRNRLLRPIKGLAFYVNAQHICSKDVEIKHRVMDEGDLLVWFDMPPKGTIHFSVEEHCGEH